MSLAQQGYDPADYDVDLVSEKPFGLEVVDAVGHKGFCTLGTGWDRDSLDKVVSDCREIQRFYPPPELIVDGLLGESGSSQIAELQNPSLPEHDITDGAMLRKLDSYMSFVANAVDPFLGNLGFACGERTLGLLHKVNQPGAEDPQELTEAIAGKWLHTFRRHRLMCLVCLGTKGGALTLAPYDLESESETVKLKFGEMIVFRADAMSHSYAGNTDKDFVLNCWLLQPDRSGPRGAFADDYAGIPLTPVAKDIVEWANGRLQEIKLAQEEDAGSLLEMDIPRGWKYVASHSVYKGVQVAVRGVSLNMPTKVENMTSDFAALAVGADFGVEVPFLRWNHFQGEYVTGMYDPDPNCFHTNRFRTNIRHASFVDGPYLFDNKFFNMSLLESKVTDPCQRLALEGAYEALHMAGYNKKALMQAFIGVYQGHTASDWDKIEHDQAGGCAGSYSPTIASNRISFALGVMGPSFTIDVEAAASLAAIYQGCHDVVPSLNFKKPLVAASLCAGVTLNLSSYWWPVHNQFMSIIGRSLVFDNSSSGYIKGEGAATAVLKRSGELVEGEVVLDESMPNLGIVSGWSMINSGSVASLTAPHGPVMQRMVADSMKHAMVTPLDIDAIEIDGKGALMHDAVEVSSLSRVLRGVSGGDREMVAYTASKSKNTNCQETAGISAFFAVLVSQRNGINTPNIHLKVVNPYIDYEDDHAIMIPNEPTCLRSQSSFYGCMAHGMGGTNVHTLLWAEVSDDVFSGYPKPELDRKVFSFWPGGGGELEDSAKPERGYFIVGSWASWEKPEKMRPAGQNTHAFIVTLGENRFEHFQIWIDGDNNKVLHPGTEGAPSGADLEGPVDSEDCRQMTWMIDGRPQLVAVPAQPTAVTDESDDTVAVVSESVMMDYFSVKGKDFGMPGDQYQVKLQVAGKWRSVIWEKLPVEADAKALSVVTYGSYYVVGSWSQWSFQEMKEDPTTRGLFSLDAKLSGYAAFSTNFEFRIVRNKDWTQVFYPTEHDSSVGKNASAVGGPEDDGQSLYFFLQGTPGDVFRIEFQRDVSSTGDVKNVSWRKV